MPAAQRFIMFIIHLVKGNSEVIHHLGLEMLEVRLQYSGERLVCEEEAGRRGGHVTEADTRQRGRC